MRVRLAVAAWDAGVDDLAEFLFPSLLQDGNVPWLIANGFRVGVTVYALEKDARRAFAVTRDAFIARLPSGAAEVRVEALSVAGAGDVVDALRAHCFVRECTEGQAQNAPVVLATSSSFWGNGTLRNLTIYCRKSPLAVGATRVRVRRDAFRELRARYRAAYGDAPVSNARLVDAAFLAGDAAFQASNVDEDANASYATGLSWRRLADDLASFVDHMPLPVMFWPRASDVDFFKIYAASKFSAFFATWQDKLTSERRWRVMASTDLAFLVDVESFDAPTAVAAGRKYNDDFALALPHAQNQQLCVVAMRRAPFLGPT